MCWECLDQIWFYVLSAFTVITAIMTVSMRNPVSCAMSMVASFVGVAGLFIGLDAYFVGIVQIIVYTGAVMVLFLFIIMLLNLKKEESHSLDRVSLGVGALLVAIVLMQVSGVTLRMEKKVMPEFAGETKVEKILPDGKKAIEVHKINDAKLIAVNLFEKYPVQLWMIGAILLSATVGVVSLTRKKAQNVTDSAENKI